MLFKYGQDGLLFIAGGLRQCVNTGDKFQVFRGGVDMIHDIGKDVGSGCIV